MFAQRIKKLRLKNDLTQKDLSDFLVVTPKTVSFYELGQRMPPANVLMKLCQKFNVSVDYLLGLTDIPETIDTYIAKQKKTGTQPAADEYSADERKIIDMYRQLSEKDKGKIEGRLEEMLDDEQATTKGA